MTPTREQVIQWAKEAGWGNLVSKPHIEALERFAALARKNLEEQLAAANAEIERLKSEGRDACVGLNDYFGEQLAATQAENVRLREAMQQEINYHFMQAGPKDLPNIKQAISHSTNTSALEAMIQKAGEVMRERCAVKAESHEDYYRNCDLIGAKIRALPGVTMGDVTAERATP